jgi:tetratricopeptide (TPR) repeat protein
LQELDRPKWSSAAAAAGVGLAGIAVLVVWMTVRSPFTPQSPLESFDLEQAKADAAQYFNHQKFMEAQRLLEGVLRRRPADADAHKLMAEVCIGLGRLDDAYKHARAGAEGTDPEAHFMAGVLAWRIGQQENARDHYARAASLDPSAAKYAIYLGSALLELGRVEEATVQAERAHRLDASAPEVHLLLANIAERQGQVDRAIAAVTAGIEFLPRDSELRISYLVYKARLLRVSGRPEQALTLLHDLRAPDSQIEQVSQEMAWCYESLGDARKAAAVWAQLFSLQPDNARAAAQAGLHLLRLGERKQAARYLGQARALNPEEELVKALQAALAATGTEKS